MSGGGGSQTSTGTQYTTNLPEYAQEPWLRMVGRTEAESNRPYQAYPDQRVAGFNAVQQRGAEATMGVAPSGYTNVGNVAQGYAAQPGYTPISVSSQRWTAPGVADSYMDPYARGVTDIAVRDTRRAFDEQQPGINMKAAQAGAYGGSRQGLVAQARERDQMQLEGDMRLKGMQQGWQSGMGQFNADEGRFLQAEGMSMGDRQFAENAAGQRAAGLASMYGQQQQLGLAGAQAMMGIGALEQGQQQRELDMGYQDFINQRDSERQNLAFYNSILRGMPATPNSDVTQTTQTNPLAQGVGAGIAGLGLYNSLSKSGALA